MTKDSNLDKLIGAWETDPSDQRSLKKLGFQTFEFTADGELLETMVIKGKVITAIPSQAFRVEKGVVIITSPHVWAEAQMRFRFQANGKLVLYFSNFGTTVVRSSASAGDLSLVERARRAIQASQQGGVVELPKPRKVPKKTLMGEQRREVKKLLQRVSQNAVKPYLTTDFGRRQDRRGLSVVVSQERANELMLKLREELAPGLVAYLGTTQWLGDEVYDGVEVAVGPGDSQFDIVRLAQSNAGNYDMTTEEIIEKLTEYDRLAGIRIFHAETDRVEFDLLSLPKDLPAFAQSLYEFCPDIVDQGVETVAALEQQIASSKQVFLWWD